MDCLEGMKLIDDNSVSAIVTDPPYGLSFMGKDWDKRVPGHEFWEEMLRICKPGAYLLSFAGTRTQHRMGVNIEDSGWQMRDTLMWMYGSGFPKSYDIGKNIDGWDGYGTGLKPAYEPIILAQKPREKTFVNNALTYGCGGLNIDGCKIGTNEPDLRRIRYNKTGHSLFGMIKPNNGNSEGRFPANIILDKEAGCMLDEQSGKSTSKITRFLVKGRSGGIMGKEGGDRDYTSGFNDSGGASRFFYCAKASKAERNLGCEELEEKENLQGLDTRGRTLIINDGSKTLVERWGKTNTKNNHPTVKPLKLMEYLIKLIKQPKENLIVDPFAGSGSTLMACKKLGCDYIGFELSKEYCEIANKRVGAIHA